MNILLKKISTHFAYLAGAISGAGSRGALAYAMKILRFPPQYFPRLLGFASFRDKNEFENVLDNFLIGNLRFPQIEQLLANSSGPTIVDCGVNVGITVRWWLNHNSNSRVVAIDMMQEALSFTKEQIEFENPSALSRCRFVEAALSDTSGDIVISFDNALEGTNSLSASNGKQNRVVRKRTLDDIVIEEQLDQIDLIKLDIEGAGAAALAGAATILEKTRYLIAEHHTSSELAGIGRAATGSGMILLAANDRIVLFGRVPCSP